MIPPVNAAPAGVVGVKGNVAVVEDNVVEDTAPPTGAEAPVEGNAAVVNVAVVNVALTGVEAPAGVAPAGVNMAVVEGNVVEGNVVEGNVVEGNVVEVNVVEVTVVEDTVPLTRAEAPVAAILALSVS